MASVEAVTVLDGLRAVERPDGGLPIRIAPAAALLILVAGWVISASAHHPGGESEPLVLIDGRKDGYRVVLETYPPHSFAGSLTQFMLWVSPEWGSTEYRGAARLWIQEQSSASAPPVIIPMPEEGRRSGVYLMEHRFDQGGTFRVEVELAGLPTRWTGTLQADPAGGWLLTIAKAVVIGALVAAFVLYLWRKEASRGRVL